MAKRCLVAVQNLAAMRFQPFKERGITKKPVFDHFGVAGAQFPHWQRCQRVDIDDDGARLVKGADQILAGHGVDPCLAADRTVDLRQ